MQETESNTMDSFEQNDDTWFRHFMVSAAKLLKEDCIHDVAVIIGLSAGEIEATINQKSKHLHFLKLLQTRGDISSTTIDPLTYALQRADLSGVAKQIRDRFELCKRTWFPKGVSSTQVPPELKKTVYNEILNRLRLQQDSKITFADSLIIKRNVPGEEKKPIDSLLSKLACLDHRIDKIPTIQRILRAESWENNDNDSDDNDEVCIASSSNSDEDVYHNASDNLDAWQNAADLTDSIENTLDCGETDNWVSDDESDTTKNETSNLISYKDVVYVFVCSLDAFLLQDILFKMSACQMAVPLLLPNHINSEISLLLWGLRKVTKSWYDHSSNEMKSEIVVSFPFLTVSAIRLGEIPQSKSKILNNILSHSRGTAEHPHFLTIDQDSVKPICSNGVLETFWYLPNEERGENCLQRPMCFFNLRGDAIKHQTQAKFAFKCSFAVIVFINSESEKGLTKYINNIKSLCEVILVKCSSKDEKRQTKYYKHNLTKVYANSQTYSETSAAIAHVLIKLLNKSAQLKRICLDSLFDICKELQIQVDEENSDCAKAKSSAKKVINMTLQNFPNLSKSQLFPAQECWKKFQDQKKKTKPSNFDTEDQMATQRENLRRMWQTQLNVSVAPGILKFYESLLCEATERQYFLEWMHIYLDDVANMTLKPLLDTLEEKTSDKMKISSKIVTSTSKRRGGEFKDTGNITELKDQEIKLLKEKEALISHIDEQNLGIEHFFRELTQLSNSYFLLNNKQLSLKIQIKTFPKLLADVLLNGYPIELLDGDTNSISLQFLHELIKALRGILGNNPRVYVISILGVQSSGKSTLLNAMFGLRLPVSAGRCTRGAYLQLIPLHKPLAKQLGCDYIAVIDSEGLMAPEKLIISNPVKDNELATFAICISDLTLINIGGQVVGEDMTNILQIAAHAFIRMKAVDLDSNCRIIQQFVADITANNKNEAAMQSIVLKLDEAIQEAAKVEGKLHLYRQFTDVFKLENLDDDSKNLQYVPSLWRGFMEVPNYQYGVVVQLLKSAILREVKKRDCSTISDIGTRIADVWHAISTEDFVFGFQDTKEATLYEKFMTIYRKWLVPIRSQILEKRLVAGNKIKNASKDETHSIMAEIEKTLKEKCEELKTKIEKELQTQDYKYIKKHETYFLADLLMFEHSTKSNAMREILELTELMRKAKEKDHIVTDINRDLCIKAADVAKQFKVDPSEQVANPLLKSKESEILIDEEFKIKWDEWTEPLKEKYPVRDTKAIECDLQEVIKETIITETKTTSLNFKDLMMTPLKSYSQSCSTSNTKFKDKAFFQTALTSDFSKPDKRFDEIIHDLKHKAANYLQFNEHIDEILKSVDFFLRDSQIQRGKINFFLYASSLLVSKTHECQCNAEVDLLLKKAHNHKPTTDLDHRGVLRHLLTQSINELSMVDHSKRDVEVIEQATVIPSVQADDVEDTQGNSNQNKKKIIHWLQNKLQGSDDWLDKFEKHCNTKLDVLEEKNKGNFCAKECIKEYAKQVLVLSTSHKGSKTLTRAINSSIDHGINRFHEYHTKYFRKMVDVPSYRPIQEEATNLFSLNAKIQQVLLKVQYTAFDINEDIFKNVFTADNIERMIFLPPSTKIVQLLDLEFMKILPSKNMPENDLRHIHSTVNETKLNLLADRKDIAPFNQTVFAEQIADLRSKLEDHENKNEVAAAAIIHICSWMIPISTVQVYQYEKSQNVFTLIEKDKGKVYQYFKSLCSEHEDKIVAEQFFKQVLEPPLLDCIIVKVMPLLLKQLIEENPEFLQKRYFIGKILESLVGNYQGLTDFLQNFSTFGKNWTLHRIAELCSDQKKNVLTELASQCFERLINQLSISVDKCQEQFCINGEGMLRDWIKLFCNILEKETDIICKTPDIDKLLMYCSVQNFDIFSKKCKDIFKGAKSLVSKLDIPKDFNIEKTKQWFLDVAPNFHNELFQTLEGCGEQCPFCGSVCDDSLKKHSRHFAALHYPQGINGWRYKYSQKLFPLICTSAVDSEEKYITKHGKPYSRCYKNYEEDYPEWLIRGVKGNLPLPFWQFIFARYNDKLAERHNCKPADIPCEWQGIDIKQAIDSLSDAYHIN